MASVQNRDPFPVSPKLIRNISRAHKILGLLIGLQLLFSVCSGFFFTLYPIESIRGDDLRQPAEEATLDASLISVSAQDALSATDGSASDLKLKMFMGEPVWLVSSDAGLRMISAVDARAMSPISVETARTIATAGLPAISEDVQSVTLMEENPPREYGGALPAYIVEFGKSGERVYIDATTGDIKAVRKTEWRIYDVLWRFHIMDVTGDDRFDSWWLKIVTFSMLIFVLTGFGLLAHRISRRRLLS